jgi:DNA polymerase-4
MPLRQALRRCPDAAFLPTDHEAYEEASAQVMEVLRGVRGERSDGKRMSGERSDGERFGVRVEVLGWDEAFVGADTDDPEALARDIRHRVAELTGLSCSVGVGDNKQRAKLATGFVKPKGGSAPDRSGTFRLTAQNWSQVMADRPTDALWGIGKRLAKRLSALGIDTVGDLAAADPDALAAEFGPRIGPWLRVLGTGAGGVEVYTEPRVAKGRSHSQTFPRDLTDPDEIRAEVVRLATAVAHEVFADARTVERVAVTVRTKTFFTSSHSKKLPAPTTDVDEVVTAAVTLLAKFPLDRPVRLLGVRVDLADADPAPS